MLLPVAIFDDFLNAKQAGALLSFVQSNEDGFAPSGVHVADSDAPQELMRRSLSMTDGYDEALCEFHAALDDHFDDLCATAHVPPFKECEREVDLVAHLDGHHYRRHVDTLTEDARSDTSADRMISLVYYFHAEPKAFSGGELTMHPIGGGGQHVVEPRHNRLVAFSSISPHEVLPISLPGNRFADARFSVACWMCRARK
ncbi:MAG: 2OG-Fe(II) oxygenase [Pseudomonadota bacterium]|nr:2OG-Fe(II) oxygenase [Pseudomonadota bacterium]